MVGLRREDREDGVVRPPREGVGVRDGLPLSDRELTERIEALIFALSDDITYTSAESHCFVHAIVLICISRHVVAIETNPTHHIT